MAAPSLPEVVLANLDPVVAVLEAAGLRPMLVGALAAWAWGHPRTSGDIDLVVMAEVGREPEVASALATLGWAVGPMDRNEFGRFFRVQGPTLPVEVFIAAPGPLQQRELERAAELRLGPRTYRVISKEDFVLRKLVNLRLRRDPHDRLDVLMVLWKNLASFDAAYVRRHCGVQRVCGVFEAFLEEARTQPAR